YAWRPAGPERAPTPGCCLARADPGHLRPQPRHVREPAHPSLTRRCWRAGEPTTRWTALAPGGAPSPRPEAVPAHSGAARLLHEYPQPPARSLGDGAGPSLGRRHHLSESRRDLALSRRRHGPLLAPDSLLEPHRYQARAPPAEGPYPRCPPSAPTARRHLPQRPRRRVRRLRVPRSPSRSGVRAEHEPAKGDHRQRAHGVILSLDEERRRPRRQLHAPARARAAGAQLYPVLQRPADALGNRRLFSYRL